MGGAARVACLNGSQRLSNHFLFVNSDSCGLGGLQTSSAAVFTSETTACTFCPIDSVCPRFWAGGNVGREILATHGFGRAEVCQSGPSGFWRSRSSGRKTFGPAMSNMVRHLERAIIAV